MRQRDHAFLERLAAGGDSELHVHGIGVADGDAGLEPAEVDLPGAAERIGPGFEVAEVARAFKIDCSRMAGSSTRLVERVIRARHQREELVARFLALAEGAQHGAGDGARSAASRRRASSCRSGGLRRSRPRPSGCSTSCIVSATCCVKRSCNCRRRANMSTMRGILLSPITLSVRQIGHVHGAEERQQVVLAHAVKLDVLHHHHLVALLARTARR